MPTLKAIRCSSLKSGRHDTKCLEEKKKKGLEKGEPLQPASAEKEGGKKGESEEWWICVRRENCKIKSLAPHADSTGST